MRKANLHNRCQRGKEQGVIGNFLPCFVKAKITLRSSQPHPTRGPGKWHESTPSLQCHPMGQLYSGSRMCTENTAEPWCCPCCGCKGLAGVPEHCTGQSLRRKVPNSCLGFRIPSLGLLNRWVLPHRWDPKHGEDAGSQGMWMTPWKYESQGG